MTPDGDATLAEGLLPAELSTDAARLQVQPCSDLARSQAAVKGSPGVIGGHEFLLSMQERSVLHVAPILAGRPQRHQINSETLGQSRMGVLFKIWICQEAHCGLVVVKLDQIRLGWPAGDKFRANRIHPQYCRQAMLGTAMNI